MRRIVVVTLAALVAGSISGAAAAASPAPVAGCTPRLLVLSAFPAELGKIFSATTIGRDQPVVVNGREFYEGRLGGKNVALALTGIGPANAEATAQTAFASLGCGSGAGITGVVFSGVAGGGGPSSIGDVTVPDRWTLDDGATWQQADLAMLDTARQIAPQVPLERTTPAGDPACACIDPDLVKTVTLPRVPRVIVGGDGATTDPFGGRAVPCVPYGGDLIGCEPCPAAHRSSPDAQRFVSGMVPLLDPGFFEALLTPAPASGKTYEANDEETAAVARVAARNRTPMVAFRAISDGKGDPLMLPGFPAQFFVYKQLAADNAAATALAFLKAWRG